MTRTLAAVDAYSRRDLAIIIVLLVNGLVWFYVAGAMIANMLAQAHLEGEQEMFTYLFYFAFAGLSAFVGSLLLNKMGRIRLLRIWVVLGVIVSIFPVLANELTFPQILTISAVLGLSFGFGMPSCLSYFARVTNFQNRGLLAGLIFMITNLIVPMLALMLPADLMINCLTSAIWKSSGVFIFLAKSKEKNHLSDDIEEKSFRNILSEKPFISYFTAWLMFCFIERMETPLISDLLSGISTVSLSTGALIGAIASFVAGMLSDRIGRKKIILFCFVTFGVAYAVIGLAPYSTFSWYLYLGIYSITSGALWMIFILIIWGELANSKYSEKHYALGELPYFLAYVAQLFVTGHVLQIEKTSAFSIAALFLFLAIIPLMYAPETLPEKRIKEIELKDYIKKAKKIMEKRLKS